MRIIATFLLLINLLLLSAVVMPAKAQTPSVAPRTGDVCIDDYIDPAQYNSKACQDYRRKQLERFDEKFACEQKRDEGFVWIVFARQCTDFKGFGQLAISYLLTFSSVIAGVMFIIASFKYLNSRGDPSKLADAKDMLINAAIGIVVIATAYVIIQIIDSAFNISNSGDVINILPFIDL